MKTGKFLLTAFASLALSTAAYADEIKVANWVPQDPATGEAIYVKDAQTDEFYYYIDADKYDGKGTDALKTPLTQENGYSVKYMMLSSSDKLTCINSYGDDGNIIKSQPLFSWDKWLSAYYALKYRVGKHIKTLKVAFISEEQYKYHVAALKAADILNGSDYTGSTFNDLKELIEGDRADWEDMTSDLAGLLGQYETDKKAVEDALAEFDKTVYDNVTPLVLGTLGKDKDGVDNWKKYIPLSAGIDEAEITIATGNPKQFKVEKEGNGFWIEFVPVNPKWTKDYANLKQTVVSVVIPGLKKRTIKVLGLNPMTSFSNEELVNEAERTFVGHFTHELTFYAAGYQDMYEKPEFKVVWPWNANKSNEYDVKITKVESVDPGFTPGYAWDEYKVTVTLKEGCVTPGQHDALFYIQDKWGEANQLQVKFNVSLVDLKIEDLNGNDINKLTFTREGTWDAETDRHNPVRVAVHYKGFLGAAALEQIKKSFPSPFSATFVSADVNTGISNHVEGEGIIYLDITCAPVYDFNPYEATTERVCSVYYANGEEVKSEITLVRNDPKLSYADEEEHEITLSGEETKTYVNFIAEGFENCYGKSDIDIYTDVDVFIPGKSISWNKNRAVISLEYLPDHANVAIDGHLYIRNNATGEALVYVLHGLEVSPAKLDELHGISTGIENVEAEGAAQNGVMFNVAGQRVNGAAKGLVIKNGKKYIVK